MHTPVDPKHFKFVGVLALILAPRASVGQVVYPVETTGLGSNGVTVNQDFINPAQYTLLAQSDQGWTHGASSPSFVTYSWFNNSTLANVCGGHIQLNVPWTTENYALSTPSVTSNGWLFVAVQMNYGTGCSGWNWAACDWEIYGVPRISTAGLCAQQWNSNPFIWRAFPVNYGPWHHPGSAPHAITIPAGYPGAGRTYVFIMAENPNGDSGEILYAYSNATGTTWNTFDDPGGALAGQFTNDYIAGAPSVAFYNGRLYVAATQRAGGYF